MIPDGKPRSATAVAAAELRVRRDEILNAWESAVRALPTARVLDRAALRDEVPSILDRVAADLVSAPGGDPGRHARHRAAQGVDVETVLAELSALRGCVVRAWADAGVLAVEPLAALERALHEAAAEAARCAAGVRERFFAAVDAFSRASLESRSVQELLERLLDALLGSAWSADTAAILLREDDHLVLRASRGLSEDVTGTSLEEGEGFAGKIAAEGRPVLLRNASAHPLVRRSALRGSGVRALYGVPLRHGDQVIGVAHIGSTRSDELMPEEIRLCDAMATRAAGSVALHIARVAAEDRARELSLLARVSDELAAEPDLTRRLERAAQLAVPDFADLCGLVLLEPDRRLRRIAVHVSDAAQRELAREVLEGYPVELDAPRGIGRILREGVTELVADAGDDFAERTAGSEPGRVFLERLGLRSYLGVPLRSDAGIIGALAFGMASSGRHFDERSVEIATELARRAALAIENARLLETTQREARAREQILAVVSHDLRTPLSAISVGAYRLAILAGGAPAETVRSIAEVIRRSARRMERLIGDLVDVAAVQAGRVSIHPAPHLPGELVREAVDSMQAVGREHGIELDVDADPDLPRVRADHDRILQVLGNLVSNAVKVTAPGGRIGVHAEVREAGIRFVVADTGPGIAPGEREQIFEPFRRGAGAAYRGTGLGLAIARGIVEAHGGRIGVESRPGAGSEFWFTLPLADVPAG
ncbi:MAG TPA: ATP-binding protein [Anaeromyxobacter sp.]|nr:ATP-binding protein [Anaeromyxobacter sp.]